MGGSHRQQSEQRRGGKEEKGRAQQDPADNRPVTTNISPVMMAWPKCSRSIGASCLGRFHASRATIIPANDTALIAKTAAGPDNATTTPPMAGPIARAALPETLPKIAAAGICSRGTTSG